MWIVCGAAPTGLSAAGFAISEQSVRGLGTAFAGAGAGIGDVSFMFYNPAGLARGTGTELSAGLNLIIPSARFEATASSDALGRPLTGGDGGDAGRNVRVPNLYFATELDEDLRFGVGVNVPFGLTTRYQEDWKGRYDAIDSELRTVNINPALAWRIDPRWSVGAGINAQYLDIDLSNAVDFGTVCLAQLGAAACSALDLEPQEADGLTRISGDNWSWGFNAGVLLEPVEGTRFGLAYRSKIAHTVSGDVRFDVPQKAQVLLGAGAFADTGFRSRSELPETLTLGASRRIGSRWRILADLTWTRWSRFRDLRIDFRNPKQPDTVQIFDWKDTLRVSVGLDYRLTPSWMMRMGLAYDESPVRDAKLREFRIPDADRYWMSWGLGYRPASNLRFNLAYAHIIVDDESVDHVDAVGHALSGTIDAHVDILSVEMQMSF